MATLFDRYPPALRIQCPTCGARPAQPCRSRRKRRTEPHAERVTVATTVSRRHPTKGTP